MYVVIHEPATLKIMQRAFQDAIDQGIQVYRTPTPWQVDFEPVGNHAEFHGPDAETAAKEFAEWKAQK